MSQTDARAAWKATPWNTESIFRGDVREFVTPDIVLIINTAHDHEGDGNHPIWIIWDVRPDQPPQIDTLCDTADSAVYHYGAVAQEIAQAKSIYPYRQRSVFVERVPANHRFASSISHVVFEMGCYGKVRVPRRYRQGD